MRKRLGIVTTVAFAALTVAFTNSPASAGPTSAATDVGTQSLVTSFFTGTVAPGATKTYVQPNTPAGLSYVVGLSPKGASTTQACLFEVTSSRYRQLFGGERQFWYQIKNVGAIACGADVFLYSLPNALPNSWSTGGLNPGQSVNLIWNNANPVNSAYVVGIDPKGATSTSPCVFENTGTSYVEQPNGEREFHFTLTNVGSIACTADVLLSQKVASHIDSTGLLSPGAPEFKQWNNANPLSAAYFFGFTPHHTLGAACQLVFDRGYYAQVINANGTVEREFRYQYHNEGGVSCSTDRLLAAA
jgi:hypothetical protein